MNCSQCQGIEDVFDQEYAAMKLNAYRTKGPEKTTRMLVEALKKEGVGGMTLLDIGGGIGAVQHELLDAGAVQATDVDASSAYLQAATEEAGRRGLSERIHFLHGNFVELAPQIPPADIVTLDRVVCCYDDMQQLVELSAARAGKLYGMVYPRDTWFSKIGIWVENLIYRLQKNPFRAYVHSSKAVDAILRRHNLLRRSTQRTLTWQVVVYG